MPAKPKVTKTVAATAPVAKVKSTGNGAPDAVKAKPAATAAKAPSQEVIPALKSTALSLDVGPLATKHFASAMQDERQKKELEVSLAGKRRDGLVITTSAIVKLAKGDKNVKLEDILSSSEQVKEALLLKVWLGLGFKHVIQVGEEGATKPKVVWVPDVAQYVHASKKQDSEDVFKQKQSVRSNMQTQVKKCVTAALRIVDAGIDASIDKDSGQLRLTGPAVREQFGQTSVLLNENQTVQVKDKKGVATGETVKLKEKPSFQAIATKAAESHGSIVAPRVDSRKEVVADPEKEIVATSKRYVAILEGFKKLNKEPTGELKTALESVYNAIDALLV